ncbi:MAG TPA: proline racemase family protein, partial [Actinomycetota bacterium]
MAFARRITAVDAHACGEPGRVIVDGMPDVPGATMFEKMVHLRDHEDWLRRLMLREPRGYPAANCNLLLPPTDPTADAGYVIMEQTEYPPMSGTNTICVTTVLLETGIVRAVEPVTELMLETPAGLVRVTALVADGKVTEVTFRNVPAFAAYLDATVDVPELGQVRVDVAWGGMFYAIADATPFRLHLVPDEGGRIVRIGEMIKAAAREQLPVTHPENPAIEGISISQLSGPPHDPTATRRNAVIVSTGTLDWERPETWTGAIDRSPCGTGTCAAMAVLHAKGDLGLEEDFVHEGILGTRFVGRLVEETTVGDRPAVVPTLG